MHVCMHGSGGKGGHGPLQKISEAHNGMAPKKCLGWPLHSNPPSPQNELIFLNPL